VFAPGGSHHAAVMAATGIGGGRSEPRAYARDPGRIRTGLPIPPCHRPGRRSILGHERSTSFGPASGRAPRSTGPRRTYVGSTFRRSLAGIRPSPGPFRAPFEAAPRGIRAGSVSGSPGRRERRIPRPLPPLRCGWGEAHPADPGKEVEPGGRGLAHPGGGGDGSPVEARLPGCRPSGVA
jgi:hypothetical protein